MKVRADGATLEYASGGEATMATIGDDRVIVGKQQRVDGSWLFTICYTAHFADDDLGQQFDDTVRIGGSPRFGQMAAVECPVPFRASGHRVFRKKRIVVRSGADGLRHGDPVCAWIRLHRRAGQGVDDEQCTPPLAP